MNVTLTRIVMSFSESNISVSVNKFDGRSDLENMNMKKYLNFTVSKGTFVFVFIFAHSLTAVRIIPDE